MKKTPSSTYQLLKQNSLGLISQNKLEKKYLKIKLLDLEKQKQAVKDNDQQAFNELTLQSLDCLTFLAEREDIQAIKILIYLNQVGISFSDHYFENLDVALDETQKNIIYQFPSEEKITFSIVPRRQAAAELNQNFEMASLNQDKDLLANCKKIRLEQLDHLEKYLKMGANLNDPDCLVKWGDLNTSQAELTLNKEKSKECLSKALDAYKKAVSFMLNVKWHLKFFSLTLTALNLNVSTSVLEFLVVLNKYMDNYQFSLKPSHAHCIELALDHIEHSSEFDHENNKRVKTKVKDARSRIKTIMQGRQERQARQNFSLVLEQIKTHPRFIKSYDEKADKVSSFPSCSRP